MVHVPPDTGEGCRVCVESGLSGTSEGVEALALNCEIVMRKCVSVASRIAFACAAFGAVMAPAAAADLNDYPSNPAPMKGGGIYVPSFSWTGFYLGGHMGYGLGDSYSKDDPYAGGGNAFDGNYERISVEPTGWMGGGQLGYNWQNDAFVFGLESDLGFLGTEDKKYLAGGFEKTSYGWYGTATARLGFSDSRWLFYGKGGLAFANIKNAAGGLDVSGAVITDNYTEIDEIRTGWAAGGGIEYAFQRDWSMKLEYLYMGFGKDTTTDRDGDLYIHDNDLHTVKIGLNYRLQPGMEPLR